MWYTGTEGRDASREMRPLQFVEAQGKENFRDQP